MDLALNNLQRLTCHKPNKPTNLYIVGFYSIIYFHIYI